MAQFVVEGTMYRHLPEQQFLHSVGPEREYLFDLRSLMGVGVMMSDDRSRVVLTSIGHKSAYIPFVNHDSAVLLAEHIGHLLLNMNDLHGAGVEHNLISVYNPGGSTIRHVKLSAKVKMLQFETADEARNAWHELRIR